MALEPHDIRKLLSLRASCLGGDSGLILGDCAFLFSQTDLADLCGDPALPRSGDPATLADVARALRFSRLDTIDLFGNPTLRFDLQSPAVPPELHGRYDWIIDAGTLFCCFNVSRVLQNVLDILKPAGTAFHLAGLSGYLGRSYYSLSPMLFSDFYTQNGFEIVEMGVRVKPRQADPAKWYQSGVPARVLRRLGRTPTKEYGWQRIDTGDSFVASAEPDGIRFTNTRRPHEPDILPNNALIMCVATRERPVPFKDAVPGYYAR